MKKILITIIVLLLVVVTNTISNRLYAQSISSLVEESASISVISQSKLQNSDLTYSGNLIEETTKSPNTSEASIIDTSDDVDNTIVQTVEERKLEVSLAPQEIVESRSVYEQYVSEAASLYDNVSVSDMDRMISCESGFNPNSFNRSSGATGIAQFMPSTYNGSWNPYAKEYPVTSAKGQIFAMALKIHLGGKDIWSCK